MALPSGNASEAQRNKVIFDHVIRVAPDANAQMRTGYMGVALSHPTLGRPLMKSLPYGSSVPEIEPQDFLNLSIVRLVESDENHTADLAELAASLRGKADILENQLAAEAEEIVEQSIFGGNGVNNVPGVSLCKE